MKFQVGDRVSVYGPDSSGGFCWCHDGDSGTVHAIHVGVVNSVEVKLDNFSELIWVHPKQCRRLKKKPARRRVWISPHNLKNVFAPGGNGAHVALWGEKRFDDQIEFIEVRKPTA